MSKKFLLGLSVSLLALAACSNNTASVTPTDENSEYSSTAAMDQTTSVDNGMNTSDMTTSSSSSSLAAMEQNEGTSADASTDAMGH